MGGLVLYEFLIYQPLRIGANCRVDALWVHDYFIITDYRSTIHFIW